MHTICLVYANSKYYNSTARIIVLMQVHIQNTIHPPSTIYFKETCNLLIDMARKFLDPTSIFQIEVGLHVL